MDDEYFDKLNDNIMDIEEVAGADIKINPDYYIHNIIIKGQSALLNTDLTTGIIQFTMCTENLEILCKAAKLIDDSFESEMDKFKKTEYYTEANPQIKQFRLSNQKWKLLLTSVFQQKVLTHPMELKGDRAKKIET